MHLISAWTLILQESAWMALMKVTFLRRAEWGCSYTLKSKKLWAHYWYWPFLLGDANAALAELDQGLRCGRLGEQSEAIVKFPRLFAKYPFPILINSALLKLADIFRQSSNFIKLCVLRVVQQSERHLDKITNVDEFVKRVSTVLHSNDPVARALTLR